MLKISLTKASRLIFGYMLAAFTWWAVQLWQENDRVYEVERALLEMKFTKKNQGLNETQFLQTSEYQGIEDHLHRHRRMIIAEGLFFAVCLLAGLGIINRSVRREISLTRQRRNFMLSITHELKSPIASLRLSFETILKRDLQRPQVEKLCSNGLADAGRLQNLVESLLLAARLEDNWRPLIEPVDLGAVAKECIATLQPRFPNAHFKLRLPEQLPPVQADKSGLTSVMLNLLENAAKYASDQPEIEFVAERLLNKTRIQIIDNGKGIPDLEKNAIFDKFYRIGNEETRKSTGTGLGLYIAQQVVKAHHGVLTLSDNKPSGAIFTIEL